MSVTSPTLKSSTSTAANPSSTLHKGGALRAPPGKKDFWVAKTRGSGEQALTWDATFGRWSAVVMNAYGARGVHVTADAGIKLGWAIWVGLGMFVVGLLMSGGAVVVIVLSGRGSTTG